MSETRNIIVMGASAGGFEAFRRIVEQLPPDFNASIFIVWHMAPSIRGVLPEHLNKCNSIYAAHAFDGEPIEPNRIYIAPPDHHMLLEDGVIRVSKGPKENRFRPAVDPLFRSAAYTYGNRVIGVILTGALDDGTSGLWTIKNHGGLTIAQDPYDAEVRSMPENAIREVVVDHIVSIKEIPALLVKLSSEIIPERDATAQPDDMLTKMEIRIAEDVKETTIMKFGEFTPFTCPECHGVLSRIVDGHRTRFRCHTGHAFSADALLDALTENIEEGLWYAIRSMNESIMLLNHIGDHYAEINQPRLAAAYFKKAMEAETRSAHVRQAVSEHEQLSKDGVREETKEGAAGKENGQEEQ